MLAGAAVLALGVSPLAMASANAQGKLDARYVATLAGVPIGKGAWVIDIDNDQFTAVLSGATTGLMRVFSKGRGTGASRGVVRGGQPVGTSYASAVVAGKRSDDVHMALSGSTVKEVYVAPPTKPDPKRVPLEDAHRRGVMDPMTASLIPVPGTGNTFVPTACARNIPVFDGRMRFDVKLSFKRMEKVRSEQGYEGTVVVCAVQFQPIAGHVPDRSAIKYLVEQRDIETWLAPIAGTRLMVPYRVSIPTPIGLGVLQATHFMSVAQSSRPTPSSAKTQ
jgi:hypothetical protein